MYIIFMEKKVKISNDDPTGNSLNEYYMPLVEMKDFNALIDTKQI